MKHSWRHGLLRVWIACAATLGLALALLRLSDAPLMLFSLGGSCVILFGMPHSPMAQPRSLVGGHVISTGTGLAFSHMFDGGLVVMACAVATALALMILTDTVHSPAGGNPLIVISAHSGWSFMLDPVAIGVAILLISAVIHHRTWLGQQHLTRRQPS
jgi:CBS-domain-containing membrane protein